MEILFNYFWLVLLAVNGINALFAWRRVQPYVQKNPELRAGYLKIVQTFFIGTSVPWVVMGIGVTGGGVSQVADYFYPRTGNLFVIAWWVSLWILILLCSDWIWFRGGAETLIKHPGFLKGNPTHPRTIKLMCLPLLFGYTITSVVIFSLNL